MIDWSTLFAIGIALVAMGIAMYRQQKMPRLETREQALSKEVSDLRSTVDTLQVILNEKQQQIEALRLENADMRQRLAALEATLRQPSIDPEPILLAVIGDDRALQIDLTALRSVQQRTGLRFIRLMPPTRVALERLLERHRKQEKPLIYIHFAVHSDPEGLQFSDGLADGLWLSQHLAGIQVAVIAGCNSDVVADLLGVVPAVVAMREEIEHNDARIFTEVFWMAIGQGRTAEQAYQQALKRVPPAVAEYLELLT